MTQALMSVLCNMNVTNLSRWVWWWVQELYSSVSSTNKGPPVWEEHIAIAASSYVYRCTSQNNREPLSVAWWRRKVMRHGVLEWHTPQAFLNTVFFFNGTCFALWSGACYKQCSLRFNYCQMYIEAAARPGEKTYLAIYNNYKENISRNIYREGWKEGKPKQE